MKLSAFEAYTLFLSIKNHFTKPTYDYFKYNGKTYASRASFEKRKDKYQFDRLAKKYDAIEMKDLIIANIIKDRKWVGDYLEEDSHDDYITYVKRRQSFTYVFSNELEKGFSSVDSPKELFKIKPNQYPKIIQLYLNGEIHIDTFSVLDDFIKFSDKFDKKLGEGDVIWSKVKLLSVKILPFIEYDKFKFKTILKQKMDAYNG